MERIELNIKAMTNVRIVKNILITFDWIVSLVECYIASWNLFYFQNDSDGLEKERETVTKTVIIVFAFIDYTLVLPSP